MSAIEKLCHECETEWHPEGPVFETKDARTELRQYREALTAALAALRLSEYGGDDASCAVCGGMGTHAETCELRIALALIDKVLSTQAEDK